MISDGHDQVVALISENLTRRQLDDTDPIQGDPFTNPEYAQQWLDRLEVESRLIQGLLVEKELSTEAVGLLIAFASTAVEMWAMYTGRDPLDLVQNIAVRWKRDDSR